MTKKHFIALADVIRRYPEQFSAMAVNRLADYCESVNNRFDRERWLGYIRGECGPNGGKVKHG